MRIVCYCVKLFHSKYTVKQILLIKNDHIHWKNIYIYFAKQMIQVYENSVQNITKSENSASCFIWKKRFLQLKSIGMCFKTKVVRLRVRRPIYVYCSWYKTEMGIISAFKRVSMCIDSAFSILICYYSPKMLL